MIVALTIGMPDESNQENKQQPVADGFCV